MIGSRRMSRMIRKVVIGVSVMTAVCVLATLFFLDAAAARILTTAATRVLGTTTTVRSVHLGLLDGKSMLDGLQIAQPPGFGEGPAMISVQHASVTAGLFEIIGKDVVIESVEIDGVELHLVEAGGRVNLQVVASNLGASDAAQPATPTATADSGTVTIRKLRVTNIRVTATGNAALTSGKTVEVTIPDIEVNDLGTKTPVSEVAARVTTELMSRLTVAIVQAKIEGLPNEMVSGLSSAASTLGDLTKSLLEESGDAIQKGLKGAGDAIKGLFGD